MELLLESHEAANKGAAVTAEEEGAVTVVEHRQAAATPAAVAAAAENELAAEIEQAVATLTGPLQEDLELSAEDEREKAAAVHEEQAVQGEQIAAAGDGVMEDIGMAAEERDEAEEGEGLLEAEGRGEEARQPVGKRGRRAELDFIGLRKAAAMNSPWQAWIAEFPR